MTTYGCALELGDLRVTQHYDPADDLQPIAVERVAFDWGRRDPMDDTRGSTAHVVLLDRDGRFVTSPELHGRRARILLPAAPGRAERTLVRGTVERVTVRQVRLSRRRYWRAELTLSDALAEADAWVPLPPLQWGMDFVNWLETNGPQRLSWIRGARGVLDRFSSIATPAEYSEPYANQVNLLEVTAQDRASLLELVTTAYRVIPMAAVSYDPDTRAVTPSRPVLGGQLKLTSTPAGIAVRPTVGQAIPASLWEVDHAAQLEQTAASAIDVVQSTYSLTRKDPNFTDGRLHTIDWVQELRTQAGLDAGTSRTLEYDLPLHIWHPDTAGAGFETPVRERYSWAIWRIYWLAQVINAWNYQVKHPAFSIDLERPGLTTAQALYLLTPRQLDVSLYLPGDMFYELPHVGPQWQIIGGSWVYEDGRWTVTPYLQPTLNAWQDSLGFDRLFLAAMRYVDLDPAMRWVDLNTITQGSAV